MNDVIYCEKKEVLVKEFISSAHVDLDVVAALRKCKIFWRGVEYHVQFGNFGLHRNVGWKDKRYARFKAPRFGNDGRNASSGVGGYYIIFILPVVVVLFESFTTEWWVVLARKY